MRTIKSPDLISARYAGVSSIAETTFATDISVVISIPTPPNSPLVWMLISLRSSAFKKEECGSSEDKIPEAAASTN